MEKIDFSGFNKPKYFPMWLCEGDTLKLAELSDSQLDELDRNTRAIADQFDIGNAVGAELDRIGKILGEERNGNTDRIYRIYLRLRTMLNTADGTAEDIIRFVKFFFSSETVHLVPNYPAGLRILHDGFNDTVDFNRIIRQIVGAGISYDTRELFNMTDEFPAEERDEKRVHRIESEHFPRNSVFRDGRVLRDGVTVLPEHLVPLSRDGAEPRNGRVGNRGGNHYVQAWENVNTPVFRNQGIIDLLAVCYRRGLEDIWRSYLKRNGAVCRNGNERRGMLASTAINDSISFDNVEQANTDVFPVSESDEKNVMMKMSDGIGRNYVRNGGVVRNKTAYRASDRLTDFMAPSEVRSESSEIWAVSDNFSFKEIGQDNSDSFPFRDDSTEGNFKSILSDGIGRGYKRDGTLRRGRAAFRSSDGITDPFTMHGGCADFFDGWAVSDSFDTGVRRWFKRGGTYFRDGGITRKSGVLEAI